MARKSTNAEAMLTKSPFQGAPSGEPGKKQPQFSRHRIALLAKRQTNLLASLESKVLRNEKPGAIHDLRVASRRLQQILDLLYPKPRAGKIRKIRRTLRRARRSVSNVRNTDVLLKKVERCLDRKWLAHQKVWSAFQEYLQQLRADQMRKASRKLSRLNLAAWYLHVKAALAPAQESSSILSKRTPRQPPNPTVALISGRISHLVPTRSFNTKTASSSEARQQARPVEIRTALAQALLNTWEVLNEEAAQSQKEPTAKKIHAVRIAGKKLRYLIEVMRALRITGTDPVLDWLKDLQRDLGDWHDMVIMEQMMIEMVRRPKFLVRHLELGVEAEKLVLRNRKIKQAYQDRFFEMVKRKAEWEGMEEWIQSFTGLSAGPIQLPVQPPDQSQPAPG